MIEGRREVRGERDGLGGIFQVGFDEESIRYMYL